MSDTPPNTSPPSRLDQIKALIGDLARPFVLIVAGAASGLGIGKICWAVADGVGSGKISGDSAAIVIGAVGSVLALLFGAKAIEVANVAKHEALVRTAAVTASPTAAALAMGPASNVVAFPAQPAPAPAPAGDDDGTLPLDQRVA